MGKSDSVLFRFESHVEAKFQRVESIGLARRQAGLRPINSLFSGSNPRWGTGVVPALLSPRQVPLFAPGGEKDPPKSAILQSQIRLDL